MLYRQPVPRVQFVALVLGLFAWWGICSVLLFPPLDEFFIENVFSWLPGWFLFAQDFTRYSTATLLTTWIFGLVVNGIAGPVGRGDVLPRVFAAEDLTSWGVGATGQHGVLLALPLLHTLAERRPHHWALADGLCGVVEEEHLREHGRSRPGERHPNAVVACSTTRSRPQLAYLKPWLVLLFTELQSGVIVGSPPEKRRRFQLLALIVCKLGLRTQDYTDSGTSV